LNYPFLQELLKNLEILYHPLLPSKFGFKEFLRVKKVDILVIEGGIKSGFTRFGTDVEKLIEKLLKRARRVVCVGSCAAYGGVLGDRGVAFKKEERILKDEIINIPGCPAHPEWIAGVLWALIEEKELCLDAFLRPKEFFAYTVHAGCTRNEYFEWKVDARGFGQKEGCLFYEQGCQAPYTHGSCNRILWNEENSKTRAGTPCFGCTEPTFPTLDLFTTKTYMGIPAKFPLGVPKRAYLSVTAVAKSFRIERLQKRLFDED
jgi:hydrogenase small subunit